MAIYCLHSNAIIRKTISDISCIAPKLSPVKPPNLIVKICLRNRQTKYTIDIAEKKNKVKDPIPQGNKVGIEQLFNM